MSAAPGCEFPNPCPVCGSTDEHAEFRERSNGMGCTFCPHPAQPGHGTGCCCAGRSKPLLAYSLAELGFPAPSSPAPLTPDEIRQLLRESVTVIKPGEVLFFTAGDPNWTPTQLREIQDNISAWLEYNAPEVKVLVLPHGEMAVAESGPD